MSGGGPLDLTIIITAANEELNIGRLLAELSAYRGWYSEILVVDSSTDRTPEICRAAGAHVIREERAGKGVAVARGVREAATPYVIVMDADISHRPEEIPTLVERLAQGYEVVKGSRYLPGGGSEDLTSLRRFFNWIFTNLANLFFGASYTDLCYGFFGARRDVFLALNPVARGAPVDAELYLLAAENHARVCEVPSFERLRPDGPARVNVVTSGFELLSIIFLQRFAPGTRRFVEGRLRHDRWRSAGKAIRRLRAPRRA